MTPDKLVIILSGASAVLTLGFAVLFLFDQKLGMEQTMHQKDKLPLVMAGRYAGFALLTLGAILYRDFKVIAGLFAVFAILGFVDTWIYAASGHPFVKHLMAGSAASAVVLVALLALRREA